MGENEWLRGQAEQFRLKLKEATEENDKLQPQKSSYTATAAD